MKPQNKIKLGLLLLIGCMLGIINMSMHIQASSINWNLKTVVRIEQMMESTFVPVLSSVKQDNPVSVQDWVVKQALDLSGVLTYYHDNRMVSENPVDSTTEEWILQAQAMDENMINEDGELVGEEVVAEPIGSGAGSGMGNITENTVAHSTDYHPQLDMAALADPDYLLSNYYIVDRTVSIDKSLFHGADWMGQDLSLAKDVDGPQILIYHTHSQETFTDSTPGDLNTTVVGVGDRLTEILTEEYGIEVLHDRSVYDMIDGKLDRSYAYDMALGSVEQILADNPSIEMVIDLHRDGVGEDTHLVTMINDKPTAQIMYFNGMSSTVNNGNISSLSNPYIQDNLALSLQMQMASEDLFPGFTRRIYLKSYRYNLHLKPKCMLIEAGAQTNSLEEMYNAMEVLAEILYVVVGGEDR